MVCLAMHKHQRFLWLEGVFDDSTVHTFKSISAASNFWQKGFLETLRSLGSHIDIVGFPAERVWPFGRLLIQNNQATLLPGFGGLVTGYINLPTVRDTFQYHILRSAALSILKASEIKPDYSVVFSCLDHADEETPAIRVANYIREHHGVPWICIVADGATPPGADRYVFLPWANFAAMIPGVEGIHLDGGIADVRRDLEPPCGTQEKGAPKVLMYMGALTEHGGITGLARAFTGIHDKNVELWICGRGKNPELDLLARNDHRIWLRGFVETDELDRLAKSAYCFVNPRPNSFEPNRLNYPSKLLHYLAYGKPVVSTFTDGMSPEYANVLLRVEDESEAALANAMRNILAMPRDCYDDICRQVARFNETHTWTYQVSRFLAWLEMAGRLKR